MPDDEDNLSPLFEALLSTLEHVLSSDHIWELQVFIEYDEHKLALQMLSKMLRDVGATVPDAASELFLRIAEQLGLDPALWRDICKT